MSLSEARAAVLHLISHPLGPVPTDQGYMILQAVIGNLDLRCDRLISISCRAFLRDLHRCLPCKLFCALCCSRSSEKQGKAVVQTCTTSYHC